MEEGNSSGDVKVKLFTKKKLKTKNLKVVVKKCKDVPPPDDDDDFRRASSWT